MRQDWVHQDLPAASLWRRLTALAYDAFLVAAIWFITAGIWVAIYPYTGLPTDSINGVTRATPEMLHRILFPIMVLETWGFYAWFWLHGGQTLGMRAWKIMSRDVRRQPMTFWQTVARFMGAIFSWAALGGGYLLALASPYQTLHDRVSATETVVVPKAG